MSESQGVPAEITYTLRLKNCTVNQKVIWLEIQEEIQILFLMDEKRSVQLHKMSPLELENALKIEWERDQKC